MSSNSAPSPPPVALSPLVLQMAERLQAIPFFTDFPQNLLFEVAQVAEIIRYEEGEDILRQGQYNSNLFFLISGVVGVYVDGGKVAELKNFGDLLGEMSVIQGKACTAAIRAEESVELFRIGAADFNKIPGLDKDRFQYTLYRIYASVLSDKLVMTNQKAKHFENLSKSLAEARESLKAINADLEIKVEERTRDLKKKTEDLLESHKQLESQNYELVASHKKLEELYTTKKVTFAKLEDLYKNHLLPLKFTLEGIEEKSEGSSKEEVKKAGAEVMAVIDLLEPITSLFSTEQAMGSQSVLLADSEKKQQIIAKMALGGTGAQLKIVSSPEELESTIESQQFDIVFADETMLEKLGQLHDKHPRAKIVFMTSQYIPNYLPQLKKLNFLPNVVSRYADDRAFTMKNIVTSVTKLASKDIFGIDKYLSWGVDIHNMDVSKSWERSDQIQKVGEYFTGLGVRRTICDRVSLVLEELLMNAIYDAPVDENGKPLYNHLPRTEKIELDGKHKASLQYATDGLFTAVSVSDPNGTLTGHTILKYLESCYEGEAGEMQENKGGAGRGLHQIVENSDLVVFNVRPGVRTEVIALFNVDTKAARDKEPSFHLFIQ